ncbi:OprD family outer membrane porin, partial [Pseudomonas viridiflava]|uniref:OprD family outer membrane porin n=1 Tax=Pseudomonas viridiflava TaxID=33069 RepID=UPI001F1199E4
MPSHRTRPAFLGDSRIRFRTGFLDDSTTTLLARNYFQSNDYRSSSPSRKNYKQEWAQGFIGTFTSGFTDGTIGVGLD